MGWTSPRTWVTSEVVTAAQMNAHVRDNLLFLKSGVAAVSTITASVGPTSSTTELVVASQAVSLDGSTLVEIAFTWYNINKTIAGDTFDVYLYDGPTAGSGTLLAHWIAPGAAVSSTVIGSGSIRSIITPSAGAHTYTARIARTAGSGTATMSASATNVATLSIWQVN